MKVRDLVPIIFDKVVIYKSNGNDFVNLYNGSALKIPDNLLGLKVISIGAKTKNVLDIKIYE